MIMRRVVDLARSVGADEPVERAPRHLQVKVVDRDDAAEPLGDTLDRDRSTHGMTPVEIQDLQPRRPRSRQAVLASGFARDCRLLRVRGAALASVTGHSSNPESAVAPGSCSQASRRFGLSAMAAELSLQL